MPAIAFDPRETKPIAKLSRRMFLLGSGAAAGAVGFALYSSEIARHEISVVDQAVAIRRLPPAFHGFRIVQISDIHFDEYTEPSFVRGIVERVNQLAPDLLLLTGDFVSYGPLPLSFGVAAAPRCAEVLRGLACPQRFAVMGNHDTAVGVPIVIDALSQVQIPTLLNNYVPIERHGQRLWLCGVADPATSKPDLYYAIPPKPDGPVILMAHAPDFADQVIFHPRGHIVDLMLSGHTHGGQIRLPLLGAFVLPSGGRKYVEGMFRLEQMQLYVNRGIGTTGVPFRLNCPPEITLFTLVEG
ncbi:MAG: metallophosphoesterase [Acidobacteriota bacterium]|nr:metallophosphoesterase [Acidobacteriota bacterium]